MELVAMFSMLAGAISFVVHYQLLRRGPAALWQDLQTRWLLFGVGLGTAVLGLVFLRTFPTPAAFRVSAFQFVSAMTCTGFQTTDLGKLSEGGKFLLTVAMVVGGAAGSTAGGLKVMRLAVLVRGVSWQIRRLVSPPDAVLPCRFGSECLPPEQAYRKIGEAAALFFLWIAFLFLGAFLLSQFYPVGKFTLADFLFEVASAQGNVGLSVGITHPQMPTLAKLLLSFHMWVGRLEIIPVLILVRIFLGRR
jgi:trk system potassium uptake protein TrkH